MHVLKNQRINDNTSFLYANALEKKKQLKNHDGTFKVQDEIKKKRQSNLLNRQ